jgi:hypothetical protein
MNHLKYYWEDGYGRVTWLLEKGGPCISFAKFKAYSP